MSNGQGGEGARKETPEERLARIQAEAEQRRKAQEERLAGLEGRTSELEKRRAERELTEVTRVSMEARVSEASPSAGTGPKDDRLAAVEAKLRQRREREERIRRMERIADLEKRMAARPPSKAEAPPHAPQPVTYVRARGARVGSLFFFVLLAVGLVLLIPDLLKDMAGIQLFEGLALNNSTVGWFFQPVPQLGDAVTGLGLVGIVLVATAIAILGAMLVVYRKR